jgi:hypothetical protein
MMDRMSVRVICDDTVEVEGRRDGDRLFVAESELVQAVGWDLKPQGLCRGNVVLIDADP